MKITTAEFENLYGSLFSSIFIQNENAEWTGWEFVKKNWCFVLYAGSLNFLCREKHWIDALTQGSRRVSQLDSVVLTTVEFIPHDIIEVLTWDEFALGKRLYESNIVAFDTALFDTSARWGALSSNADEVCVVGGDDDYMNVIFHRLGGVDQVKAEFLSLAPDVLLSKEQIDKYFSVVGWDQPI